MRVTTTELNVYSRAPRSTEVLQLHNEQGQLKFYIIVIIFTLKTHSWTKVSIAGSADIKES